MFKGGDEIDGIWNSVEKLNTTGFGIRTLIVGVLLYLASRFLPQRAGGQYAGYDFTFFWMMGGLIASPLFDSKISFTNTIIAAVTIYILHYVISFIGIKFRFFAKLVYGQAEVIIADGRIQRKNMLKSLFPLELLLAQLREMDVPNISEVDTAVLETNGHVSVLKKAEYTPVTPEDLNIPIVESGLPITLINDGKIIEKNLQFIGNSKKWLEDELLKLGIASAKDVYLASIDKSGKIYCSLR